MVLDSYECELCNSRQEETLKHLFLSYPYATACWNLIDLYIDPHDSIFEAIDSFKRQLHTSISLDIIILLCWAIWTSRNDVIFQNNRVSLSSTRAAFKKELTLLLHCVKSKHKACLEEWINSFGSCVYLA